MCGQKDHDEDENRAAPRKGEKLRPWTREEMEEAIPLPLPEIGEDEDKEDDAQD
ncbi:hypothetical protein [Celeribacter arenosi]|uniref:Uncharacterized protein n=1 Tax=Celeribacter arenosi TaxID=792649 RepID=A0ABP7KHB6_9RHOB